MVSETEPHSVEYTKQLNSFVENLSLYLAKASISEPTNRLTQQNIFYTQMRPPSYFFGSLSLYCSHDRITSLHI